MRHQLRYVLVVALRGIVVDRRARAPLKRKESNQRKGLKVEAYIGCNCRCILVQGEYISLVQPIQLEGDYLLYD